MVSGEVRITGPVARQIDQTGLSTGLLGGSIEITAFLAELKRAKSAQRSTIDNKIW